MKINIYIRISVHVASALLLLLVLQAGAGEAATSDSLGPRAQQLGLSSEAVDLVEPSPTPATNSTVAASGPAGYQNVEPGNTADTTPITEAITATVSAILAAYEENASLPESERVEPVDVPSSAMLLYLPSMMRERPQATPTPTATPTTTPTTTPTATPTATPTPKPKPEEKADIAVTIWPRPSIRVARDGVLAYQIRVRNRGKGDAEVVRVRLPYNRQQLTVTSSKFERSDSDWVSERTNDHITVTFGEIDSSEATTATLFFRVNRSLADNTILSMRATYEWSDAVRDGSGSTNWAPVLVGSGNDDAPWVWFVVDPLSGTASTTRSFYSNRFAPGEEIFTWLNTPSGVRALDLRGTANQLGEVHLSYQPTKLTPGTYQMVAYGHRSGLTGVATFYVR